MHISSISGGDGPNGNWAFLWLCRGMAGGKSKWSINCPMMCTDPCGSLSTCFDRYSRGKSKNIDIATQVESYEIRIRQYTDVNAQQPKRFRPYFAVLHGSVLRSYFFVSHTTIYSCLAIVNDLSNMSFRTVTDVCMQKRTTNIFNDDKQPFPCACRWSYFIVNDMGKYSRSTEPCDTELYGKIRSRRPY